MRKVTFLLIMLIGVVLFSSLGYAYDTGLQNYWNFTGLTDLVGAQVLVNTGATSDASYPTYAISGSSTPNSFDLESTEHDYLSKTDAWSSMSANTFTISWWFKPESTAAASNFKLFGAGTDHVRCDSSWTGAYYKMNCMIYDGSYLLDVDSTAGLAIGSWNHIVLTCDPAKTPKQGMYINGVLNKTGTSAKCFDISIDINSDLWIGQNGAGVNYADGMFDEFRIYNTYLNASQVLNLYKYGIITTPAPSILSINNDYNITSNVFGSRLGWRATGLKNVNVTSNTLTGTFSTNINSNCSISKYNLNYDQMFANWTSSKMATTNTVSHSFTYPYNLTNGTQCVYIACKSTSGAATYANSSCLNVTRIQTAYFSPVLTTQTATAGAQKNYTVTCLGYPTTMTYSSNVSTAISGSTISSSTGLIQMYPSFLHLGNRTISVTCNNGYQANTSTFKLITSEAGVSGSPSCTQYLQTDFKTGLQINYNLTISCYNPSTSVQDVTMTPPTGYGIATAVTLAASGYTKKSFYKNELRGTSDANIAAIAGTAITGDLVMTTNSIKNFVPIDPPYAWTKDGVVDCNMSMHSYVPLNISYILTFRNSGLFVINNSLTVKGFYKPNLCTMFIKPPGQLYIKP